MKMDDKWLLPRKISGNYLVVCKINHLLSGATSKSSPHKACASQKLFLRRIHPGTHAFLRRRSLTRTKIGATLFSLWASGDVRT